MQRRAMLASIIIVVIFISAATLHRRRLRRALIYSHMDVSVLTTRPNRVRKINSGPILSVVVSGNAVTF